MKLIIAGGRDINPEMDYLTTQIALHGLSPTEIVCGGARGVDLAGELWAEKNYLARAYFSAEWDLYGKSAGPRRNRAMAAYGDALLLIWDGKSKGSKNMKEEMQKLNKPVYEHII